MSKNAIQFQSGFSLFEWFNDYGTEEQCTQALFQWKWPDGFACPACASQSFCALRIKKNKFLAFLSSFSLIQKKGRMIYSLIQPFFISSLLKTLQRIVTIKFSIQMPLLTSLLHRYY